MPKFYHGKPSRNFPTVSTNRTEIFIPCKRVENNHVISPAWTENDRLRPGFKLEKQTDECLSRIMLN